MKTGLVVILVVLVAAVMWYWLSGDDPERAAAPTAETSPPADVYEYVASEAFDRLPAEEKGRYVAGLLSQPESRRRELAAYKALPKEQRERLFRNMRRGHIRMMVADATGFSELPPEEQDEYIAKKADEVTQRIAQIHEMAGITSGDEVFERVRKGEPPWMGGKMDPAHRQKRMQLMLSVTSPEERATLERFRRRLTRYWQESASNR